MRRLSVQIHLTIIVTLMAVVLVAGAFWRRAGDAVPVRQAFEVAGELASLALAPEGAPANEQGKAVAGLAERLGLDLALFSAARSPIASNGRPLPAPPLFREEGGWIYGAGGPAWAVALPDGRWLVARSPRRPPHAHPALRLVLFLTGIAALVALAAYPVVRRLTGRLERLQAGVERLGGGDLKARVVVEGRDEIGRLAESFNRSAERIEALVAANKMLLANASHELRTPLARVRLGVELIAKDPSAERRAGLEKDIAELDLLIEELLLSSRLDAVSQIEDREEIDLLALAAEEAAHYPDVEVGGTAASITGDRRLVGRLVRNLLENASKHGAPPTEVEVSRQGAEVRLVVRDHGQGIRPADRERVFEPFQRGRSPRGAGGSGLGLALVRQIARRHGGEAVLVDRAAGAGRTSAAVQTEFLVTFPAWSGSERPGEEPVRAGDPLRPRGGEC